MEPTQFILLGVSTVLGILGWSLRSQHGELTGKVKQLQDESVDGQVRLARVEEKTDSFASALREIKDDVKAIRANVENRKDH